jgi:hypothetical protein
MEKMIICQVLKSPDNICTIDGLCGTCPTARNYLLEIAEQNSKENLNLFKTDHSLVLKKFERRPTFASIINGKIKLSSPKLP